MEEKLQRYEGQSIVVTYDDRRCIHAAECVRGLPKVFDPQARPWVSPDAASPQEITAVVGRCPTGALKYTRRDGTAETSPGDNTVAINADGPLYARGNIEVVGSDNEVLLRDTRIAFCRCGASKNKPFCDGAHSEAGFEASSAIPDPKIRRSDTSSKTLRVSVAKNGPLILDGPVTIRGAGGDDSCSGTKTALCRCGESRNKPFCDGTHSRVGFSAP